MITLPNFKIKEAIYVSKYSFIYRAYDEINQRDVVIKLLKDEYPSPSQIARFEHEFQITKALYDNLKSHIIQPLDFIKYHHSYALILEDFGATSLAKFIKEKKLSLPQFLHLAILIAQTVGQIHSKHFLIKDLNPSNILWNAKTNVLKLIDFGISTTLTYENLESKNVNLIEGTLQYISPEQTGKMNRVVDYRADYYSLGVTFYEMLTGRLPFLSEDAIELIHAHIAKAPIPPHDLSQEIPESLSEIILKLLNKNPETRYQSIHGLLYDLKECQKQYTQTHQIFLSEIASKDHATTFQISEQLYGRESEINLLLSEFNKAVQGSVELTLISGQPGVGKSAIVQEIQKSLVLKDGFFISGKFDQFKRNIPYEPIVQALQKLISEISSKKQNELIHWKNLIQKAVGLNGKLIIEMIPQLKTLIGPQPDILEVGLNEGKNRFDYLLQSFIQVFATEKHPLTICLDDLHWADLASLEFLTSLLTNPATHHLYVIGTYRINEVTDSHQLTVMFDTLKKFDFIFEIIHLMPLKIHQIESLLKDTLRTSKGIDELTQLCFSKTQGNPFFLNQLLLSLYQERLIYFDLLYGKWGWDIRKIQLKEISDNVVVFMSSKILELPQETRSILQLAACLGNHFELHLLSSVYGKSLEQTAKDLWKGLEEGLILPESDNYKFISNEMQEAVTLRFMHDRVQQAAYALSSENERIEYHYLIGKTLLKITPEEDLDDQIFEVTNHLNQGIRLTTDEEKKTLLKLNISAGKKAKTSSSFKAATTYFKMAYDLLSEQRWQESHDITFHLIKEYSESLYTIRDHAEADRIMQEALKQAQTPLESAEINMMQEELYTISGKKEMAIQASLEGLSTLGISLPVHPSSWQFLKEYLAVKWNLRNRKIADLKNLPKIDDPRLKLILRILQECESVGYFIGYQNLYAVIVLKEMNLFLKYGNIADAARVYTSFSIMQFMMGNLTTALEMGKLALSMFGEFDNVQSKIRTLGIYAIMIHGWSHHWRTLKYYFKEAIDMGLQMGDFLTVPIGATYIDILDPEMPLNEVMEGSVRNLNLIKLCKYQDLWDTAKIHYQLRACLSGIAIDPLSLNDHEFNEEECLMRLEKSQFNPGIAILYLSKFTIYYHAGDDEKALDYVKRSEKYQNALKATLLQVFYTLYRFLVVAKSYPKQDRIGKFKTWIKLKKDYKTMSDWARHCPMNFEHLRLMMEGELARLKGQREHAKSVFEKAIELAKVQEYIQFEAIANELTAQLYLEDGQEKIALIYFQEAKYTYLKWGADGIVKFLKNKYPQWILAKKPYFFLDHASSNRTSSQNTSPKVLDFISIMKASQTLTREMLLSNLIEKMMHIVIENAGAEKGLLFLERKGEFYLEAIIDSNKVKLVQNEGKQPYPLSVIKKVVEVKQPLIIANACQSESYRNDPYIKNNQTKSILCAPLINLGILKGILYLENNFNEGLFTDEHLEVLNILSSQMAISIDNACFYEQLEEKIQDRTSELHRAQQKLLQKEKMAFLGLLSNGIAHEIKNPLNFIINFSKLSLDAVQDLKKALESSGEKLFSEIQEVINSLLAHTKIISDLGGKANTIVNRMIEHSSAQNRELILTNMNDLVDQALHIFNLNYPKKYPDLNVLLTLDHQASIHYLKVSPSDIKQVLINLLDNCADVLYQKKTQLPDFVPMIEILTSNTASHYKISIKDNGLGIAENNRSLIFEPFFTTKQTGEGIGLGLSISHNIVVSMHGGELSFATQERQFAEFTIQLPLPTNEN